MPLKYIQQHSVVNTTNQGQTIRNNYPRIAGIAVVALLIPLLFLGNLRHSSIVYITLITSASLVLYGSLWYIIRRNIHVSTATLLGISLAVRVVMLPMAPSLSDDAYRYLWDGRLVLEGYSPYHYIPADTALVSFHDELLDVQGYPTTNTIYPPGAQLLFAGSVAVGNVFGNSFWGGYYVYKLLLIAAEMLAIWLLLLILRYRGIPERNAMLYAWHPLVVTELAGQGHTDALWVFSIALALWGFIRAQTQNTGLENGEVNGGTGSGGLAGLAFGTAVRLFPVIFIPLWFRYLGRKQIIASLLLCVPFALLFLAFADTLSFETYTTVLTRFTNYYEFNAGFYYGVKSLLDMAHIAPSNSIAGGVATAVQVIGLLLVWCWPIRSRTLGSLAVRALVAVTLVIIMPAKVHIWYVVAPMFLAVVANHRTFIMAWMWVALVAPFTYLMYATQPNIERLDVVVVEWVGFAMLFTLGVVAQKRSPIHNSEPGYSQSKHQMKT